jgi:hypothetical protein
LILLETNVMKSDTRGSRAFEVLTVVLTCLAVQAAFTLPAYGDSIVTWGDSQHGLETPPSGNDFIAVAAGGVHSLALKADGSIVGWGYDYYGQATPPSGNDFIAIAAGWFHSLALKSDGSIVGWGDNISSQATPPAGNDFVAIAAGNYHSLALKADGSLVAWGRNNWDQVTPPPGNDFVRIAAGEFHSLALKTDGSIVGWGRNSEGQATPPSGNDFIAIAAGLYHGLALKSDGSIVGWGYNSNGQVTPPAGNDFTVVAADHKHSLALKSDGSIVGWGADYDGQSTPPAGNNFTSIAAGRRHSLALSQNSPPVADAGGPYLVALGQTIVLDGSGSYDLDGDLLSYLWTQADSLGSFDAASVESPYYTGSQAGITDLTLTVSDGKADNSDTTMLVVYDPDGGFVTGGGWIDSPAGAYAVDPWLSGKANFGFVSKYKQGATVPTGQTQFVFQAGDLDFHSSSYEWLVVNQAGTNAQFKGSGTINGAGDYKFMLWAGDDNPDTFRIKIWVDPDEDSPIYDNGFDQSIGGGSIVVHAK